MHSSGLMKELSRIERLQKLLNLKISLNTDGQTNNQTNTQTDIQMACAEYRVTSQGGVIKNSKSSQVSVGNSSKRVGGGVITFQKSPKFPKVTKFEK